MVTAAHSLEPRAAGDSGTSDGELLVRYRDRGDVAAFETLVHRYEKPMYNYLLRYLHDPSLAEDVYQSTLLRVHEKRDQYSPERRLQPWIYSIATHLAIDALRKEGRRHAASLNVEHSIDEAEVVELQNLLRSNVPSPPEEAGAREEAKRTRRLVNELPDELRQAVSLVYFQDLTYREAAEALHLPLGTVKSRLHKAMLALHRAWERQGSRKTV